MLSRSVVWGRVMNTGRGPRTRTRYPAAAAGIEIQPDCAKKGFKKIPGKLLSDRYRLSTYEISNWKINHKSVLITYCCSHGCSYYIWLPPNQHAKHKERVQHAWGTGEEGRDGNVTGDSWSVIDESRIARSGKEGGSSASGGATGGNSPSLSPTPAKDPNKKKWKM